MDVRYITTDTSIVYAGPKDGYHPSQDGKTEKDNHLHRRQARDVGCNHDHIPGFRCSNCGETEEDDPLCQGCLDDTRNVYTIEAYEQAGTLVSQYGIYW